MHDTFYVIGETEKRRRSIGHVGPYSPGGSHDPSVSHIRVFFFSPFLDGEIKDSAEGKFGASPLQTSFCSEARFAEVSREGGGLVFPTT